MEPICASLPNFIKIDQTIAEIWRFNSFSQWRPFAILDLSGAHWDHPRRLLGGLYRCAKFGWNRCSTFDTMKWRPPFWKPLNRHIPQPFDRFWWNLAQWRRLASYGGQTVKISNFSKNKMAAVVIWKKPTQFAISQQGIDRSSWNLAWLCKMGLLSAQNVKKLNFQNPRWPTLWKLLNRHISATVWPILMKFGKVMHIGPVSLHEIDR